MSTEELIRLYNNGMRNFKHKDLRGADLHCVKLPFIQLMECDLRGADLYGADLHHANLFNSDLSGADLRNTNLSGADLCGVNLRNTSLYDINLSHPMAAEIKLQNCIGNNKEIKNIMLGKYLITLYKNQLAIGCQQYTIEQWYNFDDNHIMRMDHGALVWWHKNRDFIKQWIYFVKEE